MTPVGCGWFVRLVGAAHEAGGSEGFPAWATEPVHVADHDPAWAGVAAEFAGEVDELFDGWLTSEVLHVGLTAVPGLPAKPVIDLQAVSQDPAAACPRSQRRRPARDGCSCRASSTSGRGAGCSCGSVPMLGRLLICI